MATPFTMTGPAIKNIFAPYETEFYYVELVSSLETRLERNCTENRLLHKASKRDIESSNNRLLTDDQNHRFESFDGEIPFANYIKIDNTSISAAETARIIKDHFGL